MKTFITAFLLVVSFSLQALAQLPTSASYLRPCYDEENDYLNTVLNIQDTNWTLTYTAFEDRSCDTPYLHYEVKYQVVQNKSQVDLTATEASYTALSDVVSEALNMIKYCGYTNWVTNEKKIVTGQVCDEFQTPRLNEVLYSIVETQNEGRELYLGMPSGFNNGKTAERRHQKLDSRRFNLQ